MSLTEKFDGNVDVVSLSGKLMGGPEVGDLHAAIKSCLDKKTNKIVINLKDMQWMGSVGIGILICCLTTVRNAGGDLKLAGLNKKIIKILVNTHLDHVFEIHPTAQQAVQSFYSH
jgi:anti-sigma B factor antagonist